MKKLTKEDGVLLLIICAISAILCSAFLQMHYSSDTYCLIKWGYFEYPSHYFLLDGRLISTLVCYLAGILHLPYNTYIIGMDIIGIFLMSLSVFVLYKALLKIMKIDKKLSKFMLFLATYVLIYNQFSLEFLLFPESAVMCLGVFTSVLAAIKMVSDEKYKYLKTLGLILISIFCYQGLINIFPIIAILLIILKQEYGKTKLGENIIFGIKEILKMILLLAIVVAINMITIKIGCDKIGDSSNRVIQIQDMEVFFMRMEVIPKYLDKIWNESMNMLPKHINSIIVIATILLLGIYKEKGKFEIILKYLVLVLAVLVICVVPMFIFNTGVCGRVNVPISEIWGISLVLFTMLLEQKNQNYKYKNKVMYSIIVISFIFNSVMILQNTAEHIAANRVDESLGKTIKYAIEKYEEESGKIVTKFSYAYDRNPQQYSQGIKQIGSLTERKFACSWCIQEAMEFYCGRKFERVRMPIKIYYGNFKVKDYAEFSEEQLVFIDDTLYMQIY